MRGKVQGSDLDPAQDACLKTKCGTMKLFCLCLPDRQLDEYKAQLQSEEFLADAPKALKDNQQDLQAALQEHPLQRMLEIRLKGRCAEAEKELRDLPSGLTQQLKLGRRRELEARLLGLATKYVDLLCPFRLEDLNLPIIEKHSDLPLHYGKRIQYGVVEWFSVGDYDGCDLVRALATYLEVDLAGKFYADLAFKPKELGESSENSAVWHIANRNRGVQQDICEDNVYQYQVVNALDEEAGSVLLFVWTLTDEAICQRPKPLEGFLRSGFECTIYRFVPHFDPTTRACNGLRLARANINRPPPSLYAIAAEIDVASLRESTRIGNENFYTKFRSHLTDVKAVKDRADLLKKMRGTPRRAFYDRVKKQLDGGLKLSPLQRLSHLCCSVCRS